MPVIHTVALAALYACASGRRDFSQDCATWHVPCNKHREKPTMLSDLRYAARSLRKSPGFAVVALLTLALGVGANTAIFSLVNAVLLRPLPYDEPERLVLVWESAPFFGIKDSPVSPANYVDWKARSRSFEEIGALEDRAFRLVGEGNPEVVGGALVTASLMRALRTQPLIGRVFREDEDRLGAPKVALVSEHFWRRRFNADPAITGRTVTLNDEKHTIVGVLRAGTEPPAEYAGAIGHVWAPFGSAYTTEEWNARGRHNWMVIARLKPGVSLGAADAEMKTIGAALSREYPDTNKEVGAFVAPIRDHFAGSHRRLLGLLLGTVGFVLLIACANVANLLLSRAANRGKEVAVRSALGAGMAQLARQFLCESLLLSALASALGLALATFTFQFLAHLAPGDMTGFKELSIDWRVLLFTLAIAVATAVAFGLIPLLQVRRVDIAHSLKQSSRSLAAASGSRGMRALLISSEVALAFMLLIGAGLMIRTFMGLRGLELGCRTENILTLKFPQPVARGDFAKLVVYQNEIQTRVNAIPGVISSGLTNHIPLVVKGDISGVAIDGRPLDERIQCNARFAGPGYMRTMGVPIRRGRDLDERDREGAPYTVLINETLARTAFPNVDPIGRRLIFTKEASATVVGVVGDVRSAGLDVAPKPEFYISALQSGMPSDSLAIHTAVDPANIVSAVREAIWSVNRDQAITQVATMEEILDGELLGRRVQMMLLSGFAGLALLLSAIGVYGVLAYHVGMRVPEIGVRVALGASPGDLLRGIVGYGMKLAAAGLALGLVGALAVSRLLQTIVYGVEPTDPATYFAVAVVLMMAAALASYLPARRATRIDPIAALRED